MEIGKAVTVLREVENDLASGSVLLPAKSFSVVKDALDTVIIAATKKTKETKKKERKKK